MRRLIAISLLACICLLLDAAGADAQLTGFLASPTDELAVPGMLAGAEVTPEGDVYTGWAEYELRFGRRLRAWDQPTRTLPDAAVPLLSSALSDGPVLFRQTLFAVAVGGRPVAYETVTASNGSTARRMAQVAMELAYTRGRAVVGAHRLPTTAFRYERPAGGQLTGYYEQPGQAFSPAFAYSFAGRDVDRSGLLLARGPAWPSRSLSTAALDTATAVHGARLFRALLRGHGRVSWTWQIPLEPPEASAASDRVLDGLSLRAARRRLVKTWVSEEAGMMRISVPEARVSAAYRAAIAQILACRYRSAAGWVQMTNKLQYEELWIRDAALQTQALDLAGLHAQAAQNLAFVDSFQQPDGLFIGRAGQYDALGQALWALQQHAALTRSRAYAVAQLGRMQAAIGWLDWQTSTDPLGLLPPSDPGDDELAFGRITGDDVWAAAGLRAAIADATLAGRSDLSREWQALDERFEASLGRAIALAMQRVGHIPPLLDGEGGQDWGNYYASYPVPVLAPSSQAVRATLAWARERMAQGLSTYWDGRSLHDYLGFAVFETELAAGESARAVAGLYAELAHTTSTYGGWEWGIAPLGYRGSPQDMSPHGTFAADYVALLRDMLVSEAPGGELRLLAGASPAWLGPGKRIAVSKAPTDRGVLSFEERSSAHGERLTWRGALRRGTRLVWVLPSWARHVRLAGRPLSRQATVHGGHAVVRARQAFVMGGHAIVLHGSHGQVSVSFDGRRPAQSYRLMVAALDGFYRTHGLPPPLVPAAR